MEIAQTDQLGQKRQEIRGFRGQAKAAHPICPNLRWDIPQTTDEYV